MHAYFKSRWNHLKLCYDHCKRHKVVAIVTLTFSIYAFVANFIPFIQVPAFPLPKVPLPWAIAVVEAAILFMVVEGSYRLHRQSGESSAPLALASLPIYRHDLVAELLSLHTGATLSHGTTVFLLLKTWAERDLNIIGLSVKFSTSEGTYEGQVLRDLSQWLLREEFLNPTYNITDAKETNMESTAFSLMKEIESGIFREGHHSAKWIGCEISPSFLGDEDVKKVKIRFHDKDGVAKSEVFEKWPETSFKVIDVDFRRH